MYLYTSNYNYLCIYLLLLLIRYAGILSAYGLALADVVHECIESCALVYNGR